MKKIYGWDNLSTMLALCSLIPLVSPYTICLSVVIWIVILFRTLSRNIDKRAYEKQSFEAKLAQWGSRMMSKAATQKDSIKYRYFICPACRAKLRVPRGKGKIMLTCTKCGNKFEKKS